MKRRHFLRNGSLLSTVALAPLPFANLAARNASDNNSPFKLDYAFHDGMFAAHAGKNFLDQIKFGYDHGFRSIEDNGMMARGTEEQNKIGELLAKLGMRMGVFVITSDSWHWKTTLTTGKQEWKDKMKNDCIKAVELAKRINAKWMTVVPGNFDRKLPLDIQNANVIENLRRACDIFEPHNLTMVLEPLSDNPDLFLRYSPQTYMICKAVNSPACKILFDIYHMQRNEGRLAHHIDLTWDEIGYFQIGDEPGRKEPTTGEINYKFLFKKIKDKAMETGRDFIFGMEHGNAFSGKDGEQKLIEAYRWSDNF